MRKIDKIIVHCSATQEGRHIDVDEIKRWHVQGRGWSDIGYHFVIYLDGTVVKGRPIERQGAHVKGMNKNSIGVCYIGGVESEKKNGKWIAKDTRTDEQKESLVELLCELHDKFNASIHGHNEFSNKSCPCFDAKKEYENITNRY